MENRTQDVEQIKAQFASFLEAWQTGDGELLDSCLGSLPFAYVSMYGHAYDNGQIKKWFKNPGPACSTLQLYPLQSTISTQGEKAWQYAVVLGLIKSGDEHIAFGGSFMNAYEKSEQGWKLETIRFQLQSDDATKEEKMDADGIVHRTPGTGSKALLGEWLVVDDRVGAFQDKIEHSGSTVITPEIDAPWRIVKDPDNLMTDEEKIMQAICRTSCAFDFLAMMLSVPAFDESAAVDIGGLFGVMNKRDTITYIKELRKAMPRCYTGITLEELAIEGDHASALLRVSAPEAYVCDGSSCRFVKDTYDAGFVQRDGVWAISKLYRLTK